MRNYDGTNATMVVLALTEGFLAPANRCVNLTTCQDPTYNRSGIPIVRELNPSGGRDCHGVLTAGPAT